MPPSRMQPEWLSLREASQRIGVSQATLRAWADGGRVQSFRTPGGHRRFRVVDVASLTTGARRRPDTRWQMLVHSAIGRARLALEESGEAQGAWIDHFTVEARQEHRQLGRRLLRLLTDVLREPETDVEARARALGREYARVNRSSGVALCDAVGAFVFFRACFLDSVAEFSASLDDAKPEEMLALFCRANALIDRLLLTLVESYDAKSER